MDEGLPSVSIFAFLVILLIDVFINGFSVALSHVKEDEIEKKAQENKESISGKILKFLENDGSLTKNLLYINIVLNMFLGGIVTTGLSERVIASLSKGGTGFIPGALIYLIAGLVISILIMCFGVLIPRKLAIRKPETWAYFCYYPVTVFSGIFSLSL